MSEAAEAGRAEDKRWHIKKDGTRFFADRVLTALCDDGGNLRGFGKLLKDVTGERREQEARERRGRQLKRLAEVGTRINVAHDVRSVVGVVTEEARVLIGAGQAATALVLLAPNPRPIRVIWTATRSSHDLADADGDPDGLAFFDAVRGEDRPIRLAQDRSADDVQAPEALRPSGRPGPQRPQRGRGGPRAPARVHPPRYRPARDERLRGRQHPPPRPFLLRRRDHRRLRLRAGRGPPPIEGGRLRLPHESSVASSPPLAGRGSSPGSPAGEGPPRGPKLYP